MQISFLCLSKCQDGYQQIMSFEMLYILEESLDDYGLFLHQDTQNNAQDFQKCLADSLYLI